jgi:hypothetical protein
VLRLASPWPGPALRAGPPVSLDLVTMQRPQAHHPRPQQGHRPARILDLIAVRIADLETRVAALKVEPDPAQAGAHEAPRRITATTQT